MQNQDDTTIPPVSTVGFVPDPASNTTSDTARSSSSDNSNEVPPMSDISESAVTTPPRQEPAEENQVVGGVAAASTNPQQPQLPSFKHQVHEYHVNGRRVSRTASGVPLVCAELLQINEDGEDDASPTPPGISPHEDRVIEIAQAQIDTGGVANEVVDPQPIHGAKELFRRLPKGSITVMLLTVALTIVGAVVGGVCGKGGCATSSNSKAVVEDSTPTSPTPTASPTGSPTVPPPPTPRPTVDLDRALALVSLVSDVTLEADFVPSYPVSNITTSSSLENALSWLVEDASVYLDVASDVDRLIQRYALASLYHHVVVTTGREEDRSPAELRDTWLKGDECDWYGLDCQEGTHIVEKMMLDNDKLKGTIPMDIGLLTSLTYLDLDGNALQGSVPTTIGLLANLTRIEFQNNDFNGGTVPPEIGDLTLLTHLDLSLNGFIQELPSELSTLTDLKFLYIDRNKFTGALPSALESLTKLREFWLHENEFAGSVPTGYAQWTDLNFAFFQNNELTGVMPFCAENFNFQADNGDRMIADCAEIACDCCTHCCPIAFNGIPQSAACS